MFRILAVIFGIVLAAVGGVIAYRAFYVDPSSAVIITNEAVRELPNTLNVVAGVALLIAGAAIAFLAAVRKPRS
jgi:hypothetical protein